MISERILQRLPLYANYLRTQEGDDISAAAIARELGLHQVQVRKDLAAVCSGGRPRVGYPRAALLRGIEQCLWGREGASVALAGAGNLGRALFLYKGFADAGLHMIAAFDKNEELIGRRIGPHRIYSIQEAEEICRARNVRIGVIATPAAEAQEACDRMIRGGVAAIWNFAPAYLTVPDGVQIKNENMAASLVILAKRLEQAQTDICEQEEAQ